MRKSLVFAALAALVFCGCNRDRGEQGLSRAGVEKSKACVKRCLIDKIYDGNPHVFCPECAQESTTASYEKCLERGCTERLLSQCARVCGAPIQ